MNSKQRVILTSILALIGGYLFYKQSAGISILIFTLISAVILMNANRTLSSKKKILAILPTLVCSIFILWYPQLLTCIVWVLSYMVMWSSMKESEFPLVTFVQGFVSIAESPTILFEDNGIIPDPEKQSELNRQSIVYLVSGGIIIVFVMLYINSNPLFLDLFSKIDLSFIEFGFIMTVFLLFVLNYGLIRIKENKKIDGLNGWRKTIFQKELTARDDQEYSIANISIWAIGFILLVANGIDIVAILTGIVPKSLTESVHEGFWLLLFTMSLAIGLIIYFYRGQVNFHEKIQVLKNASLFWISQNFVLAMITVYKNYKYVESYGLTYKRIAVFLGLLCVVIGLVLSINKLYKPVTNWLYFNKLSYYAFVSFIVMALIPMDKIITKFNLNNAHEVDMNYILKLSKPDLEAVDDFMARNKSYYVYANELAMKKQNFVKRVEETGWQSWNFYTNRIAINERKKFNRP